MVGGLELSITDNTKPTEQEFQDIADDLADALPGGTHILTEEKFAADGTRIPLRWIIAHGEFITAVVLEEVE